MTRDKSNVFVGGRHRAAPRLQVVPEMVDALHRGVTGEAPVTVIAFMEVAKACLSLRNPREIDGRAAAIAASDFAIIRSPLILLQRATIILHGAEVL
jgi:hypothetical protein